MNVEDVYRPWIVTCAPDTVLRDVATRMEEADTGFVAIVDDERLQAVITERDIVRAAAASADFHTTPASAYGSAPVLTATLNEDIDEAARRMIAAGVRRFPVTSSDGEVAGMLSMRDLFAVGVLLPPAVEGGA